MNIIDSLKANKSLCDRERIILQILAIYNCRASEVLEAKWQSYNPKKRLVLEGKKGSAPIIVTDRLILEQIKFLPKLHKELIFYPTKYQRLYDIIKRQYSHIFKPYKSKVRHKVTHGFRYANVADVENEDTIQAVLHHKSKKTQKYYKPQKNKPHK